MTSESGLSILVLHWALLPEQEKAKCKSLIKGKAKLGKTSLKTSVVTALEAVRGCFLKRRGGRLGTRT